MISLIVTLAILGVLLWAILRFPISEPFRTAIIAIAFIFVIVLIANFFGYGPNFPK